MTTIEIKKRYTNVVLYSTEVASDDENPIRTAVLRAVAAGADLADAYLAGADLAGADLADANLADAYLAGAYLAGADLAGANLADAYLARANLADAYLAGAYLADAYLARANLAGANLADAYLAGANLADAYLARANLAGANLADAYLADARYLPSGVSATDPTEPYKHALTKEERDERRRKRMLEFRERHPEVPVIEQLDAKILAAVTDGTGELDMSDWHHGDTCGTTHCRAGWAIHLAGEAGYALERKTSAQRAGEMIYRASTGHVPHFFATTEHALEDLKRCAAEQTAAE